MLSRLMHDVRSVNNVILIFSLAEGQRKATFEEYEAKKHEHAERTATLKQTVKKLYLEYARTINVIKY